MENKPKKPRKEQKKFEVDEKLLSNLTSMMLDRGEIVAILGTSTATLDRFIKRRFNMTWLEYRKKYASHGKMSLMRMAWGAAQKNEWRAIDKLCDVYVWPDHKKNLKISGDSEAPIQVEHKVNYDKLSVDELRQLEMLLEKAESDE